MIPEVKMGIYRHYKGLLYQVIGLAHDANADTLLQWVDTGGEGPFPLGERIVVVYIPLELNDAHLGPRMAVRTLEDFVAYISRGSTDEIMGRRVPRFEYLGPELTADMV